jgi:hypothetical protein
MSKIIKFPLVKEFMYFWFQVNGVYLNSLIDWLAEWLSDIELKLINCIV